MATWSTKRKYGYFLAFVISIALFVIVPAFYLLYTPPTCFDGKQNGEERGTDCGGSCVKLCLADFAAPRVLWSYSMRILPSLYSAFAYVQNPNQFAQAQSVSYVFKLYDSEGILVAQREGRTFVPAGQRIGVFESGIQTGVRTPTKTTFEFTSDPDWRAGTPFTGLRTVSTDVTPGATPRAEALIQNEALDRGFSNVIVYIVLYNKDDNRVAFSRTVIPKIAAGETQTLYFTWPEAFPEEVVRSEVLFVPSP